MTARLRRSVIAWLVLCVALSAWPASVLADAGRIVVSTADSSDPPGTLKLKLVDPGSGSEQLFAQGPGPVLDRPSWGQGASQIAFHSISSSGVHEWVLKEVAGDAERVLPLPSTVYEATLSRTSDEIAYFLATVGADNRSYRTLKVTTLDGQSTRTLTQPIPLGDLSGGPQPLPTWSPDGKAIAFHYRGSIVSVPAAGGPLTTIVPAVPGTHDFTPSFAPDGTRLAYLKLYDNQYGDPDRQKLVVRVLDGGAETIIADYPYYNNGYYSATAIGPQAWSPDGTQIVYHHQSCKSGVGCDDTLQIVNADGTGDHVLLPVKSGFEGPAWSPSSGPVVTIRAPAANAKLTGGEAVGAPEQQLTIHVESTKPLAGVCYAVQTDPTPVPDQPSCTNASGPTSAPFDYTTDLRPLIDAGTIKNGENIIRVWAYDQDGGRGSAEVKIVLARANYYVKHVEVAQALSPPLGALPANPLEEGAWPISWTPQSFAGFPIALIEGRSTLLRIYVGDATLASGGSSVETIHYKVNAGVYSEEGDQVVDVTAPDLRPLQGAINSSIDVWLPAAASSGTLSAEVQVNAGEAKPECENCFPHGNDAIVVGIDFENGGTVLVRPVPIQLIDSRGKINGPSGYDSVWSDAEPFLPLGEGRLARLPTAGAVAVTLAQLDAVKAAHPNDDSARCSYLLDQVATLRATAGVPAGEHWVGTVSPPSYIGCNGIGYMPGGELVLALARASTLAHELGHNLGVDHTLSLVGSPDGAPQLPYDGIGVFGYARTAAGKDIYPRATTSDVMGYDDTNPRWTSPATWARMHVGIIAAVGSPRAAAASGRVGVAAATTVRRLVSGYISGDHGVIFSSLVAPATSPASAGPVAGKVVALDRRGRALASTNVTGTPLSHDGSRAVVPFLIALPPTASAASLALRAPNGKRLATLRRSRHRPSARFVGLPRRTSARKRLSVRWKATDRDRDRLTVTLLARRGKAWHAIALGPATNTTPVLPSALGRGARLRLRLLVSDGFTTTRVDAKPVIVRG